MRPTFVIPLDMEIGRRACSAAARRVTGLVIQKQNHYHGCLTLRQGHYHVINLPLVSTGERMEDKARLTILIDLAQKKAFEELCSSLDVTSSQMVRQLIRLYLEKHGVTDSVATKRRTRN
jgi:hypothetical protein